MNSLKGCPVVQFEIGCQDKEKTNQFYSEVFGWTTTPNEYSAKVDTNATAGINGAITSLGHEPHQYINLYIEVENMEEMLVTIVKRGGEIHIGPLPTGTGQEFAWFKDPEGNMLALITPRS